MSSLPDAPPSSPRTATDLLGHREAEETFLAAWRSQRLAHAWLITGARGIGKATLAYRMARFALAGWVDGAVSGAPLPESGAADAPSGVTTVAPAGWLGSPVA